MTRRFPRRALHMLAALALALGLLLETQAVSEASGECFDATGKCLRGRFLDYWRDHGGLAINGYPLTDERGERLEDGKFYRVQYFERVRLEYHPENAPPYDVLLGQFGRRIHPADTPVAANGQGAFFPETGHNVAGDFLAYWQANGGLAQFGYPLTEEFTERLDDGREYTVQYFERARFERHPENTAPYTVLLGQFGRRILADLPPTISPGTVGQLTKAGRWGKGWPAALAFSPDGRWLAVASSSGLTLYDAPALVERRFLPLDGATTVTFAPDSQRLAIGMGYEAIEVRQVADLALLYRRDARGPLYGAHIMRFSPDGSLLAIGVGGAIDLYRAADGQLQRTLRGHEDAIRSLAFSPDSTTLVSADSGAADPEDVHPFTIKRWRVADGTLLASVSPGDIHLNGIVSPDGRLVVTSQYARITVWRFDADTLVRVSSLPTGIRIASGALTFSQSGGELLLGTADGKVQHWRVADGSLIATVQEASERVDLVGVGPDSTTGAALWDDGTLRTFRMADGARLGDASGYNLGEPLAISPDWTTAVTGTRTTGDRGTLRLWHLATGEPIRTITIDGHSLLAAAYSPDGRILASSGDDFAIQLWHPDDGTLIRTLEGQTNVAEQIVFSPDGRYLAAAAKFREVQVWRVSDGALLHTFTHTAVFGSVVFSADSAFIAFADWGKVQKRRIADGALVGEFATGTGIYGDDLALSPDGTTLITSYTTASQRESLVQFWDWETQSRLREIRVADGVLSIAFSPEGDLAALGGYNSTVQLVDTRSGAVLRIEKGIYDRATIVAFSPDGTALVSGTFDGTIHLWGLPR
ncbi:MAG: WD40 repeat domain-containing protein [Chloroflexia bacterium]